METKGNFSQGNLQALSTTGGYETKKITRFTFFVTGG